MQLLECPPVTGQTTWYPPSRETLAVDASYSAARDRDRITRRKLACLPEPHDTFHSRPTDDSLYLLHRSADVCMDLNYLTWHVHFSAWPSLFKQLDFKARPALPVDFTGRPNPLSRQNTRFGPDRFADNKPTGFPLPFSKIKSSRVDCYQGGDFFLKLFRRSFQHLTLINSVSNTNVHYTTDSSLVTAIFFT